MMRCSTTIVSLLCCCATLSGPAPSRAQEGDPPPVERRAEEVFELLRDGDAGAIRAFVATEMHPSFRELGPVELHLEQLGKMRDTLGVFEVEGIRLTGPVRGEFILRADSGERLVMHVETEPIEPYRLVGLRLKPHEPENRLPAFTSLEQADEELQRLAESNAFSGVVLVARGGRPDWVRAYGMADKERKIPNRPDTRFDVGSITKDFTAVAILQLVEQGKVELDAPISRYLDGFPPGIAEEVRVIHLLRMESGYGDYYTREFIERREEFVTISDYLEYFKQLSLEFEPGTKRRYSNVGYTILGGIVESVSGMSYPEYLTRHVYGPAGMRSSSFRDLEARQPDYAIGYTNDGPSGRRGFVDTNRSILDVRGNASGGSLSTVGDLLRFQRALRANELLDPRHTTLLLNGFEESDARPGTRGTAGGAPGVSAVSLEDFDARVNVIVLSNYDEPLAEEAGTNLFRMLRGDTTTDAPRYRVGVMLGVGPEGVTVDSTLPGSPAERAGLRPGDHLRRVNGTPLEGRNVEPLTRAFSRPEEVLLVVDRGGDEIEIRLTPEPAR
ncbi:MAG TPA: serine hydrolase [Candidatus Polarisedimenticolaceae bacterium]|nr:serine hydrolase [Candidatus Polarisedimenticolaceae bacterium]